MKLIDFYAEWCAPCKALGMILEQEAKWLELHNITLEKVDIDQAQPDLLAEYGIRAVPVLALLDADNKVRAIKPGFQSATQLKSWIELYSDE